MTTINNTFMTSSSTTNKESLSDVVSRITPEDTPIYSMIKKGVTNSVHPEWIADDLASPGPNAQLEGDEYTFESVSIPERLGNYTQIMRKSWILSGTQESVEDAGSVLKRKEQKLKKALEIRKDIEFALVSSQASEKTSPRKLASLSSWIKTNVSRGEGGNSGGYDTTTGMTKKAKDGKQRSFTKQLLDDVMQAGYQNGANFRHIVVSPYVKSEFVRFMSDSNVASFHYAVSGKNGSNTIVATADIYDGPFGKIMVHPNRVMASNAETARNAFLIDADMLEFLWLRNIQEDKNLAKTGDSHKGVLIGEGTLKVKNEKAIGIVSDLFGLSKTT
ncbi:MAG: head protein [Candidatus Liberibacter europaeus]|uniref:Head protein n=1 Tax=Candidatus Liberibacter europaeus TaxID=744859 RepID=A0A2T4VX43_9HYPH|nr:head protein [Candidatus Liberibacter europaeus]PTL86340.1 MAG: head protein [Candidatus Liberibacter europaeus]